jgi:4-hydroxy-tetrahydrodipicolinate synthase
MEICLAPRETTGWGSGVGAFKTALMLLGVIASNQLPQPFEGLAAADVDAVKAILAEVGPTS